MRILQLRQFCYCASLKEGAIISCLFFIVCNFLCIMVMSILISNDDLMPILFRLNVPLPSGKVNTNTTGTASNDTTFTLPDNRTVQLDNLEDINSTRSQAKDNLTEDGVSDSIQNDSLSENTTESSGTSADPAAQADRWKLDLLRCLCRLQLVCACVCLPLDLLLLAAVRRRHRRQQLLWLLWYAPAMLIGSCWTFAVLGLVASRGGAPLGMAAGTQLAATCVGWYCYVAVFSHHMAERRRAAREMALMSLTALY